jgi:hypothetical protein
MLGQVFEQVRQLGRNIAQQTGNMASTLLFRQGHTDHRYEDDIHYPEFANNVRNYVDDRVHGALASGARGAAQVLASGFGKGLLTAVALTTVACVGLAMFAPGVIGLTGGLSAAQAVNLGMMQAGNFLLGSVAGYATLLVAGAIGSASAAHGESTRISKETAEQLAQDYAMKRAGRTLQPEYTPEHASEICPVPGGHCSRLIQSQNHQQGRSL